MRVLEGVSIEFDGNENISILECSNGDYFFAIKSMGSFQISKELFLNGLIELERKVNMRKVLIEKHKNRILVSKNPFYDDIKARLHMLRVAKHMNK